MGENLAVRVAQLELRTQQLAQEISALRAAGARRRAEALLLLAQLDADDVAAVRRALVALAALMDD